VDHSKVILLASTSILVIMLGVLIILVNNFSSTPVSNTTTAWNYFTTTPISYQNPSCNLIEDKNYMGWKGTDELPDLFPPNVYVDVITIWAAEQVNFKTIENMSDVIIIGKVTGIKELSIKVSGGFPTGSSLKYIVLVEKVIKGNISQNEYIEVAVNAYLSKNYFDYKNNITIQGKDLNPSLVASLFPLLNVGDRYILFLFYFDRYHNIKSPYVLLSDITFGYFAYLITDDNKVYSLNNIKYPVEYDFASVFDRPGWGIAVGRAGDYSNAVKLSKQTFGACGVSLDQFLSQLS